MIINSKHHLWKIWVLSLSVIAIVLYTVMDYAPYLHIDEFTIVDLGRVIINPNSDWSIAWAVSENHPAIYIFYLGAVFQELSYQVLGVLGPRISGITGALVSATILVEWLLKRKTPRPIALVLGLVFLLDPIFVQAYTVGRIDGWAMSFCFLSCLILRQDITRSYNGRFVINFVFAGMTAVIAVFVWPSAALLFPLILVELCIVTKEYKGDSKNIKKTLLPSFLFSTGALLATLLIAVPIASLLKTSLPNIIDGILLNLHSGSPNDLESTPWLSLDPFVALIRALKFSPFLVMLSLIAAVIKRNSALIFSGIIATGVILVSLVYLNRVLYLLPYMIVLVAGLYSKDYKISLRSLSTSIKASGLVVLLIWSISISIIGRTILASQIRNEDNRDLMYTAAKDMIGSGNHAVYLPGPEFYYAGRTLGWKMYRPYAAFGDTLSPEMLKKVIPKINYVIMPEWEEDKEFNKLFAQEGILDKGWYYLYDKQIKSVAVKTTNTQRLRNLFFIYPKAYGPYKIYARKTK